MSFAGVMANSHRIFRSDGIERIRGNLSIYAQQPIVSAIYRGRWNSVAQSLNTLSARFVYDFTGEFSKSRHAHARN